MSEVTAEQVTDYIKKLLEKRCNDLKVVVEVLKFAKQYTKFSNEITNVIEEHLHKVIIILLYCLMSNVGLKHQNLSHLNRTHKKKINEVTNEDFLTD